jgi:ArsR family transcriptional regulator, arsenate/arsenite/antimonite-responsive transcriptional repressor / arsenate reductase (thioredoxin)
VYGQLGPDRACRGAYWNQLSTIAAASGGAHPDSWVHARAVATARRHGLDLAGHRPADLADVLSDGHLVVVVCDNAHEELDPRLPRLHWSIPDAFHVDTDAAFEAAYANIGQRVHRLANLTPS